MSKLITYAYMKSLVGIADIIDNEKLDNPIRRAQDRLRALIGPAFYDELISQVITTPQSLTAANTSFFDPYVKEYLAFQAYELYFAKSNIYETRTGPRTYKEDNSDAASDKTMGENLALIRQDVALKKESMINFLRTAQRVTSTAYPLFTNSTCGITGSGFGITAVSKIDTVNFSINRTIINQEPHG